MIERIIKVGLLGISFNIIIGTTALAKINSPQMYNLEEVNEYAQKADDSTLVLLDKIKPSINFDQVNDSAFEYLLIKLDYHLKNYQWDISKAIVAECESYYDQSDNDTLKIRYELARIHLNPSKIENYEPEIRHFQEQSIKLGLPDYLVEAKILLFKIFRKRLAKDSSNLYLEQALYLAKENNLRSQEAHIMKIKGVTAKSKLELDTALKFYDIAEKIYREQEDEIQVASIIDLKGLVYSKKGLYAKAFGNYQKTLGIYQSKNIDYKVGVVNRYIGHILQDLSDHEHAIQRFLSAQKMLSPDNYPFLVARINTEIGDSYLAIDNFVEGEKYLKESIALKEKVNDHFTLPTSHSILGNLYLKQDKLKQAQIQFEQAIHVGAKSRNKVAKGRAYLGLLKIFLQRKDLTKAEKYGQQALAYSKKGSVETKFSVLSGLATIATERKNYQKATQYYQEAMSLQDNIMNVEKATKVANIIADYRSQKKELEILHLKYANQEKGGIIKENKLRSNLYLLGLFSALIMLLLFTKIFIQNKKTNSQLAELNSSLNTSNQKLKQSNNQLERFAHTVSHDLKAPLLTITNFSALLQKTATSKLAGPEIQFLQFINSSGQNLSIMVDDMLAYAKLGAQKIILKETDLNGTAQDLLKTLAGQAEEKAVTLKQLNPFPAAMVDELKLKRVFQNIACNAIKFCDVKKAEKQVNFSYKELPDFYQFTIADNGIGIPDTNKNLFEPFTYLNSKKDYKGTGMGLAMCEKIVEKHGGEIWYESEEGKGTKFHFTVKKNIHLMNN